MLAMEPKGLSDHGRDEKGQNSSFTQRSVDINSMLQIRIKRFGDMCKSVLPPEFEQRVSLARQVC